MAKKPPTIDPAQKKYDALVREGMAPFQEAILEDMRKVLSLPIPDETTTLWFIATSRGNNGFPVCYLYMKGPQAVTSAVTFAPEVDKRHEFISEEAMDEYEDHPTHGAFERAAFIMTQIVGEAFRAVGGANYPLRCYASVHGSSSGFDLRTGQKVTDAVIYG